MSISAGNENGGGDRKYSRTNPSQLIEMIRSKKEQRAAARKQNQSVAAAASSAPSSSVIQQQQQDQQRLKEKRQEFGPERKNQLESPFHEVVDQGPCK